MRLLALLLAVAVVVTAIRPAAAFDLFPSHEVTAQFATRDGKPMADAEVRVFGPGDSKPVLTGHTDKDGKFEFPADRDGMWSAEARTAGEVARVMIRVGGQSGRSESRVPPWLLLGLLAVLLVIAVWYRFRRHRPKRPGPP